MKTPLLAAAFAAAAALPQTDSDDAKEASGSLLFGVKEIAAPGTPSPLAVWDVDAYVIMVGSAGHNLRAPAVVAGKFGRGRFVALPHNGYFGAGALATDDTGRFLANAVKWVSRRDVGGRKPIVAARGAELADWLVKSGFDAHDVGTKPLAEELKSADALVGLSSDLADADVAVVEQFAKSGGGVIAGQCAWGWMQIAHEESLEKNSLNRLFAKAGVAWTGGFLGKSGGRGFSTEKTPPKLTHASEAFAYLISHRDPSTVKKERPMEQAEATATALIPVLPADETVIRGKLQNASQKLGKELVPTAAKPIEREDGMNRVLLAYMVEEASRRAAAEMIALPAAAAFPGAVPADAPRVTKSVAIDTTIPRWHSTGLYAAPGELVTVAFPDGCGVENAGLVLQIGAHTDQLFELDAWPRAPGIVRRAPVRAARTAIASAFGGLVYVDVPDDCHLGQLNVSFEHVVEAPLFVLGTTTKSEWERARTLVAPWAELESADVIVTVPSTTIRALDDPESVMNTWNRVADAAADLVALPHARKSAERFVADVEISAGYMHSGYPIMTHLDAAAVMADPKKLAAGDWGLFHEFGHNHQEEDWTFEGTGEVTNNLICLYVLESVCAKTPSAGGDLFAGVNEGAKKMAAYFQGGAKFDEWKADPFLALQTYVQLQRAFGWDAYKKAFAEYRKLPRRERPKTDDARRDLWLVTMSRACQKNLASFFATWGIPISESARAAISDLPPWMPENFPPK